MLSHSVREAADQLSRVSPQDGPGAVLDALAPCVPVVGGTIGTMLVRGSTQSLTSHSVHLPPEMYDTWMSTPPEDFARMMAPLVSGPVGGLFNDRREITGELRERLDVIRSVSAAGLGEAAGFKVASRETESGAVEIVFLTLVLGSGATFRPEHAEMMAALRSPIEETLARLRVPVLSSQSLLAKIVEEVTIGYACITAGGRIVEANDRAYALALRYADPPRRTLADLARELLDAERSTPVHRFRGPGGDSLEVSVLWLANQAYALSEDLMFLVMREQSSPPTEVLTKKQREIAIMLVETDLSYKQIADSFDIEEGTMRKHAENIYRRLGVHSRQELSMRWKKRRPS